MGHLETDFAFLRWPCDGKILQLINVMSTTTSRLEEEVQTRAVDASGNPYLTIEELKKRDAERRAGEPAFSPDSVVRRVNFYMTCNSVNCGMCRGTP